VKKKTPSGQPSTDEDSLAELALDHPLPRLILEHRALSKLKSTYTDKLRGASTRSRGACTPRTHKRLLSRVGWRQRANLQNIPIRTPAGRRIRSCFIAPPGAKIVSADYSQIELRIMAHLSGDENLRRAFSEGEDVHRATAAEVFGVPLPQVDADQRRVAKVINFGLIYGMSSFGVAQNLGIDRATAQTYVDRYFARFPGAKRLHGRDARPCAPGGLRRDRVRPPPMVARTEERRAGAPPGRRARGDQRADAGAPRRSDQARDDRRAEMARRIRRQGEAHHAGARRAGAGSADAEIEATKAKVRELMESVAKLDVPLVARGSVSAELDKAH